MHPLHALRHHADAEQRRPAVTILRHRLRLGFSAALMMPSARPSSSSCCSSGAAGKAFCLFGIESDAGAQRRLLRRLQRLVKIDTRFDRLAHRNLSPNKTPSPHPDGCAATGCPRSWRAVETHRSGTPALPERRPRQAGGHFAGEHRQRRAVAQAVALQRRNALPLMIDDTALGRLHRGRPTQSMLMPSNAAFCHASCTSCCSNDTRLAC